MSWRSNEAQAEPFEIVERVAQRMDLELAAVARAGAGSVSGTLSRLSNSSLRISIPGST
jgi:hypothetical protein